MSKDIWKICTILMAVFGAALAIQAVALGECGGVLDCGGSSVPMKCHWTFLVVAALGAAACVLGIVGLFQKTKEGRSMIALGVLVLCVLVVLVLFALIGVCANAEMVCNSHRSISLCLAVLEAVCAVMGMAKANPKVIDMPKAKL